MFRCDCPPLLRYVWLPMGGRQVTTRYTARALAAGPASDSSESASAGLAPSDGPSEGDSDGAAPHPAPRRRPGRLPDSGDVQPSGSGLQSSASSSGGPRPSRPLSSASESSSESGDELPPRRRPLGKLLTPLSSESEGSPSPAPSPPQPAAGRAQAPLTNGNTKDNFRRLKRSDFRRRNYRRRH